METFPFFSLVFSKYFCNKEKPFLKCPCADEMHQEQDTDSERNQASILPTFTALSLPFGAYMGVRGLLHGVCTPPEEKANS